MSLFKTKLVPTKVIKVGSFVVHGIMLFQVVRHGASVALSCLNDGQHYSSIIYKDDYLYDDTVHELFSGTDKDLSGWRALDCVDDLLNHIKRTDTGFKGLDNIPF